MNQLSLFTKNIENLDTLHLLKTVYEEIYR